MATTAVKNEARLPRVVITRTINAPRELVFKALTTPELVKEWWGPHGFTNPVCEIDARIGGKLKICMDSPQFPNHWMHGTFLEISPELIVFSSTAFIDEKGNAGLEGRNIITLEAFGNKTKLTLEAILTRLLPELQEAADGMEQGWSESLDRLTTLLITKQEASGRELTD